MKHKQNTPIYIVVSIDNLNATVDLSGEAPEGFSTEENATIKAKEITEEYGLKTYVYKCIPVVRITRGRMRVTRLSKR